MQRPFLLDGAWHSGASAVIRSPWTGGTVAEICIADPQQARIAAQASARVAPAVRAMTKRERAAALAKISEGLRGRQEEIAAVIRDEVGKPLALARSEVGRAVNVFAIAAEEAERDTTEVVRTDREPHGIGMNGRVERFPIGAILGIGPFNFPLNLLAHKIAPALAAGCPIVVKPPPQGPSAALMLGEIFLDSGFPPAALQVLPGGLETGQALTACPEFAVISFTGSAKAGWSIKRNALPRQKVLLELGGNAAVIVDESADIEAAAKSVALAAYNYAGQICISTQRVIPVAPIAAEFTESLVRAIRTGIRTGVDPADADCQVGPLIDIGAADRIDAWVKSAMARGAEALVRGERRSERVISPWLLRGVPRDEPLMAEEAFGPVAVIDSAADIGDAIRKVNDSRYGLQSSVFTRSLANAERCYREIEAGAVLVNTPTTFRLDSVVYGGIKDSGFGREGVAEVIREFTEPKLLVMKP